MSNFMTLDGDVYSTNYSKVLSDYMNPICPTTAQGTSQVYNAVTSSCMPVAAPMSYDAPTDSTCGGAAFNVKINNACYSTNTCPTSSPMSTTCLNAQHVPFEQPTPAGPGVLFNVMPPNYWWV